MTHPSDKAFFAHLQRATVGSRALLCTLARRGKALRKNQVARAESIVLVCQAHPLYKGGRLLFDLLEVEDFMLDGPMPAPLNPKSVATALCSATNAFGDLLRSLTQFATEISQPSPNGARVKAPEFRYPLDSDPTPILEDLPEISASEYLYDLVVLGIVSELAAAVVDGVSEQGSKRTQVLRGKHRKAPARK